MKKVENEGCWIYVRIKHYIESIDVTLRLFYGTILIKQSHFPFISGISMTTHKSQGGAYENIVYEYEKTHTEQLLYVPLSKVTKTEKLYILSKYKDSIFYHGRKEPADILLLKLEFKRLSLNPPITLES